MSQVKNNILALFVAQGSSYIFPLLTLPYLTRRLGSGSYGLLAFSQAVMQYFVLLTDYGFAYSATRLVSLNRVSTDKLAAIFWDTLAAKTVLVLAGLAILAASVVTIPALRDEWRLYAVSFIGVSASAFLPMWYLQGIERLRAITYAQIAARALGVGGIFLFVNGPGDVVKAAAVQSSVSVISMISGWIVIRGISRLPFSRPKLTGVAVALKDGWKIFSSTIAINLYTTTNTVLLGVIGGREAVGYFAAAERLIEAAKALLTPFRQALFPWFSHMYGHDRSNATRKIKVAATLLGTAFSVPSAVFVLFPGRVVELVFGAEFHPAAQILKILAPVPALLAMATCFATLFMLAAGFYAAWRRLIVAAAILNYCTLGSLLLFVPPALAVAGTLLVVESFVLIGSYLFFRKASLCIPAGAVLLKQPEQC